MSNDDNGKSQWDIDRERQIARDTKRRNLFRAIAAVVLCVLVFARYKYYQYITDPLIAGIPPKENADGTIDYTLIEVKSESSGPKKVSEWVIRFPKKYHVDMSKRQEVEMLNNNVVSGTLTIRSNEYLGFSVDANNLEPRDNLTSSNSAFPDAAAVILHAEKSNSYWPSQQRGLNEDCISASKKIGNLLEYTDLDRTKSHCGLGNVKTNTLYALTRNGSLEAFLSCLNDGHSCYFEFPYGDRKVSGFFGVDNLSKFEVFEGKLKSFLESATVIDR